MTEPVDLSPEERDALRAMRTDGLPPPHLEDAVVSALTRQGLIARPRRLWLIPAAALSAAAVLFVMFWLRAPKPSVASAEPKFALLLYAGDASVPSQGPSRREEYTNWARAIAAQGTEISGEELADDADEIALGSTPSAPGLAAPRGFFIVSAHDVDAAKRIAATCPHLRYGGRIVVRRIVS